MNATLKILLCLLFVIGAFGSETIPPSSLVPEDIDVKRALSLIEAWETKQPERAVRYMRVVYWTPNDREPAPQYRERLTRVLRYAQEFYGIQMESYGLPRRTIQLETAADGLLNIRVATGKNGFSDYQRESGQAIRNDCVELLKGEGIQADDETIVIFCNLATWDPEKRTMRQKSPYYAGGTHRNGTAWQVDSPLLDPLLMTEKKDMLHDGEYGHISVGRYNSIFVGGVVHELGHAIGLPHCVEAPAETKVRGHALMGSGNRSMGEEVRNEGPGTFLTLAHALKLLTHVQFSGSVKGMKEKSLVTWDAHTISKENNGNIICQGVVTGTLPVYAVIAYADPTGGGDYNAQIGVSVPDEKGNYKVRIPAPSHSKANTGNIRLVACSVNGSATSYVGSRSKPSFPFILSKGDVDVTPAQIMIEIDRALPNAKAGQLSEVEKNKLHNKSQEIIRRILAPNDAKNKPTPANVPKEMTSIALSDCKPSSAKTGWGGVHYDRTTSQNPLISGGQLFVHGLYAHAAAMHVYHLNKSWTRLAGYCGISDSGFGPVEFVILGDGKELWKSGVVKAEELKKYDIDVSGVNELSLEARLTENGPSGAWGLWLEPILTK